MRPYLKLFLPFLVLALLSTPAVAQYYKSGKEIMVRIVVRYEGPEKSPYIRQDAKGVASKEANADRVRSAIQAAGGKVDYLFRHINLVSGSIPVTKLAELSANKFVLEVAKDNMRTLHFNPFTATDEERKAIAREKAREIKERMKARMADPSSMRKNPGLMQTKAAALDQRKQQELNLLKKPLPISGTMSVIDSTSINEFLIGKGVQPNNYSFYNHQDTQASKVWPETRGGEGIIVAVIDSGCYSDHSLLLGSVIGGELAPGIKELEQSIDNNGDGIPDGLWFGPTVIENFFHGTAAASMVVAHGALTLPANNRLLLAIEAHAPNTVVDNGDGTKSVVLFGSAPAASIYAIKAFPYDGGGTSASITMAAEDRAIDLKAAFNQGKANGINIEVVNMSFGGAGLFPGFDAEEKLVDMMVEVGIQPVTSSGNSGPAPYTVSSPGGARTAVTVAAAAEAKHNRISFEASFPELPVGGGTDMVLSNRTQVASFSSHGPLATGYGKPDVIAEGNAVMAALLIDTNGDGISDAQTIGFTAGTSFSSPTVAGGIALLTAVAHNNGINLKGQPLKAALLMSARHLTGFEEQEEGKGFMDVKAASDWLKANPTARAGALNNRKLKFKGTPFQFIDFGTYAVATGITSNQLPGEQDDFLIPYETSSADQPYVTYFYAMSTNPQRLKPFPASVRSQFDPDPTDGLPPFAALQQNTEVFFADPINTGFSDGDYIINSLNQVDTFYNGGGSAAGLAGWYPDLFPGLTTAALGYVPDAFGGPITSAPSAYASTMPHQNMGSGGLADFNRFTFIGDVTNDPVQTVQTFFIYFIFRRSGVAGPCFGGTSLCTGLPSVSGTIAQNQIKEYDVTLPPAGAFYQFQMAFENGWNNYKFGPPVAPVAKQKRKAADVDFLVTAPDGSLLNLTGFPGIFQGASMNDVEMIQNLAGNNGGGRYHVTVIGFDVKGVPQNRTKWGLRIWDQFIPILPVP